MASLRIVVNSSDPTFRASTIDDWRLVICPRGFTQRAAAVSGELRRPVVGRVLARKERRKFATPMLAKAIRAAPRRCRPAINLVFPRCDQPRQMTVGARVSLFFYLCDRNRTDLFPSLNRRDKNLSK